MSKFIVTKSNFVDHFITPLSRFNLSDKPAQIVIENNTLIGVTHTEDRHIILEATLKNIKGDDLESPVVLKDLNRLLSALGFVSEPTMTFSIEPSYLHYKDNSITFKSFFLDGRFFDEKIPSKLGKIKEQTIDFTFNLTQDALGKIRKSKQFVAQDTDKVYISGNSKDGIVASRHDATKSSIDTISFNILPSYTGDDFDPLPLDINLFDLISEKSETILVEVNKQFGLFLLTVETPEYKLQYITSALRK